MWCARVFSAIPASSRSCYHRTLTAPAIAANDRRREIATDVNATSWSNGMSAMRSTPPLHSLLSNRMDLPFYETRRCMSKFLSKSATKRLPLNTKRAKKGYYKGKGGTKEGRLTSKGKFIADPLKKLQLIVPDLEGFPLKPYIANTVSKKPPEMKKSDMPGP